MAVFEFDATNAIRQLDSLSGKVKGIGVELDKLTLSKRLAASTEKAEKSFEGLTARIEKTKEGTAHLISTMNMLQATATGAMTGIAAAHQTAGIKLQAYTDKNNELNAVLRQTDSKNIQISMLRTLNTLQEQAVATLTTLSAKTQLLNTEEGKAAANAAVHNKAKQEQVTADARLSAELTKQETILRQLHTTKGKNAEIGKVAIQVSRELGTTEAKVEASHLRQNQQLRNLNDTKTRSAATNKVLIRGLEQIAVQEAKLYVESMKLTNAKNLENSAVYKQVELQKADAAVRAQAKAGKQEDLAYTQRKTAEIAKLRRELEYLGTAEAKQAALLRQQVAEQNKALTASTALQARKTNQIRLAAQATAALRASLAGMQASIGMYTSSTIIAASATYAFARALKSGLDVGLEFTTAMARTRAIMSSGSIGGDTMFSSLSAQVRLLGETTQFTVTEVAQAVTELGQAGLSAGQSITALQPALDLAVIGNLSMASSADHVTNIMMIFGREATDLTNIVDVMATAVTNSNTNIDQLANALTYAGPAAHALGISMEDTVAAVEALANSGFKASRAGTALRRLFVSLANPTKKGQAVLDKYNIAVTDLRGNALSLSEILNQLQDSFKDLSGSEKLSSIQDLVGVYATSPVAGLLNNVDSFNALRLQLELTADAAQNMKKIIEDGLEFDFKEVKSAFQELQLDVFKDNEMQFRVWTQELKAFIQFLGSETATGATNLEVYGARIKATVQILAGVWAGMKILQVARNFNEMGLALARSRTAHVAQTAAAISTARATDAVAAATVRATAAEIAHTAAVNVATKGGKARALSLGATVLRVGGVAGAVAAVAAAVYQAYQAYQSINAVSGPLEDHQNREITRVSRLASEYDTLKQKAKEYQEQRTEENLMEQREAIESSISSSRLSIRNLRVFRRSLDEDDPQRENVNNYLTLALRTMKDQKDTLKEINRTLYGQTDHYEALNNLKEEDVRLVQGIAAGTLDVGEAEHRRIGILQRIRDLQAEISAGEALSGVQQNRENQRLAGIQASLTIGAQRAFGGYQEDQRAEKLKNTPLPLQLEELEKKRNEELLNYSSAVTMVSAAATNPLVYDLKAAETVLAASSSRLGTLNEGIVEMRSEVSKQKEGFILSTAELAAADLTAAEQRARIIEEQSALLSAQAADNKKLANNEAIDFEAGEKRNKRLLEIKRELSKEEGPSRPDKAAEANIQVFESLRQKYDAVGASAASTAVAAETLHKLLAEGKITTEDLGKSLQQLETDHYAVEQAANSHAVIAKRLSETYLKSGVDQQIQDLVDLDKAYQGVARSSEAYLLKQEAIYRAAKPSEGPKIQPTGASGLFSEFIDASLTQSTDIGTFEKDKEAYELAYQGQAEHYSLMMMAEMEAANQSIINEQDKNDKLHAITLDYQAKQKAAASIYRTGERAKADEQAQYIEQSQKLVMASMAGSLSQMVGLIAESAEEGSAAQKIAFAASKALAIAQILLQTHVAAANARAIPGGAGETLAAWIMVQGYASAGFAAALAVGEMSGSGGGSDYAGAFDKGGYIPTGKHGIVGEYGPEIVNGPAHVTGREATARKLGSDSGPQQVTIAPEINIDYHSTGDSKPEDFRALGQMVENTVISTVHTMLRPNGLLYRSQN